MLDFEIQNKWDQKTKPQGSLGKLETLGRQLGLIQKTTAPKIHKPTIVLFAADHGIAHEGVSAYPPVVTQQMLKNMVDGGACINVLCRQNNLNLIIVDAGIDGDTTHLPNILQTKTTRGTANFRYQKAMSADEFHRNMESGADVVRQVSATGCNTIGFGEMGIGNSSSASMLMATLCQLPISDCVGKGSGINTQQVQKKIEILSEASLFHGPVGSPAEALQTFGGFEMVQMCGGIIEATQHEMIVLVDGFIATSVLLAASMMKPSILKNAVFCHLSDEAGHQKLLQYLGGTPLLNLNLRLGEGTGCALAIPLIQNAIACLNEMASFSTAGVNNKYE
jgi:nicotinate-nucleotide--dimethylbenzimidazole phosphoribosyltransferase